jgi:hypothetical protein
MAFAPLTVEDKAALALANPQAIRNSLGKLRTRSVPPWLAPSHPHPDGTLPRDKAAFAAVAPHDLIDVISVRGPLHAMDGWSYVARALNSLVSGDAHAARHLAYYGQLRAALSILASSGIGVFNRRNAVVDAVGGIHPLSDRPTHEMCWVAISEWSLLADSLDRIVSPLRLGVMSLLDTFREFFPSGTTVAASHLMTECGFDLAQWAADRDDRNWSSYQPTALARIRTTPTDDTEFLQTFWSSLRPSGTLLERHLLRMLLEVEARSHGSALSAYRDRYDRLDDGLKTIVTFDFLTRASDAADIDFLSHASQRAVPAHPYSMICRAALLLRLATGMAEENLVGAGMQPAVHFETWWKEIGVSQGLWSPDNEPATCTDLWDDVDVALEDVRSARDVHRHRWISGSAGSAMRICETERAALWGLFQ